jgi:hypothetical protein
MTQATPPVGEEFGLEPRLDHTLVKPPLTSEDLIHNDIAYNDPMATEFGGVPGFVQPVPHVATASERLSALYAIDPMDDGTEPRSVLPPELDGLFDPR